MKKPIVSIDIETTGLTPETCQILEVGAVIDDWVTPVEKLPTFHCYVDHGGLLQGSPYALSMHPVILRRIATREKGYRYLGPKKLAGVFLRWLHDCGLNPREQHITIAGKNYAGFDHQFLKEIHCWDKLVEAQHRVIDPGTLYWDPDFDTKGLPDLKKCKARAGVPGDVAHNAVDDALDVVRVIRHWYEVKGGWHDFEKP